MKIVKQWQCLIRQNFHHQGSVWFTIPYRRHHIENERIPIMSTKESRKTLWHRKDHQIHLCLCRLSKSAIVDSVSLLFSLPPLRDSYYEVVYVRLKQPDIRLLHLLAQQLKSLITLIQLQSPPCRTTLELNLRRGVDLLLIPSVMFDFLFDILS